MEDVNMLDPSIADGEREIDKYILDLFAYLDTLVPRNSAAQFMKAYSLILRLSDETDKSIELFDIFRKKI
jgi:hypothetical protein